MTQRTDKQVRAELAKMVTYLDKLTDLAIEIEDDDVLWVDPQTAIESYLQEALRAIVNATFDATV